MFWAELLLPDAQGSLVERLGLRVLALTVVEVRQSVERTGYMRMLGSELQLPDTQGSLVERLGFAIPGMFVEVACHPMEQVCCLLGAQIMAIYQDSTGLGMGK